MPRCTNCGRFCHPVAWQMLYSGGPIPMPDEEIFRCRSCFERYGAFLPQSGIKPEFSCGVFATNGTDIQRRRHHEQRIFGAPPR